MVTDKSGHHVPGLKAADFSLLQDKNITPRIAFCEEITHAEQVASPASKLPPGVFSNVLGGGSPQQQRPKNVVVIAIDTINTPFSEQAYARQGIIQYLSESITPDTLVALVFMTPRGVRMLHDFTTDSATLIAALQRVSRKSGKAGGGPAFPNADSTAAIDNEAAILSKFETEGYIQDNLSGDNGGTAQRVSGHEVDLSHRVAIMDTTADLMQIAQIYSGVPGRKALVWVTSGVPRTIEAALQYFTAGSKYGSVHETDVSDDFERAWKALNDASFAVYSVDASGLFLGHTYSGAVRPGGGGWSGSGPRQQIQAATNPIPQAVHQETLNTLETISRMTGGRAYTNTNDLAKGIHSAVNDSDSYYLIGFYLDSPDIKPGWHPLKVSVASSGASIRSREGFIVSRTPVSSVERARADLSLALRSPVQFSGLPLLLRWQQLNPAASATGNKQPISFDLVVAANAITINEADSRDIHVDIIGIAQDKAGDNAANVQQVIHQKVTPEAADSLRKNGLLYRGTFNLAPGAYTVHLAVRDSLSGKLGSIIAPLNVE